MIYQKAKRIFEDSGTVNPEAAYYVPFFNVSNTKNQDLKTIIDQGRYFSVFAPRQSGKTTFFKRICAQLQENSTYVTIILSFQDLRNLDKTEFYTLLENEIHSQLINRLTDVKCEKTGAVKQYLDQHRLTSHISFRLLFEELNRLIEFKKIVIFIDEFDGIPLSELENFLTALRELYQKYKEVKQKALYSIGLVGIRNITKLIVGGISPFNIADQVKIPPFTPGNVTDLYSQYTGETNQPFTPEAVKRVHEETGGQPWLVNRLGTILTVDVKPGTVEPIENKDVNTAIQNLIQERNAHFENLYEKALLYKESFVEIVFDHVEYNPDDHDQTWLEQYGLIKQEGSNAVVANNIYKARYLKTFFKEVKAYREITPQEYGLSGDLLDMERIILDFEQYITQIGVSAFYQKIPAPSPGGAESVKKETRPYEKTGQFLLTAWLYQFVRGGAGELRYEVVSGVGRMDVLLTYRGRRYIIETKINRRNLNRTLKDGITQVANKYLASESADAGYLIVFDSKTPVGADCEPKTHRRGNKKITSFTIAIGKPTI
ncbi:MAG: hypothetical protein GY757_55035 [bacterium]|nr:hypothetical protein [bacterium]